MAHLAMVEPYLGRLSNGYRIGIVDVDPVPHLGSDVHQEGVRVLLALEQLGPAFALWIKKIHLPPHLPAGQDSLAYGRHEYLHFP